MIDIKNNFRGKYPDNKCRACGKDSETQEHILEMCQTLHSSQDSKVTKGEIFAEDPTALKETAKKIRKVLSELNSTDVQLA